MQIEAVSISKYRHGTVAGDDVIVIVPGSVVAVFDGATDARGTVVDGVPAGRLAALTVAQATAAMMQDPGNRSLPVSRIFERLSDALRQRTANRGFAIAPSTTLALALECGADWRFVLLGDSGIRLNGTDLLQAPKLIDKVATTARVALFTHFRDRHGPTALDAAELATRRGIFLGLDQAVADGQIGAVLAQDIIALAVARCDLAAHAAVVEQFLRGGICTQSRYANAPDSLLGFDTMNGTAPCLSQWIDVCRPKAEVHSIELFTDGYPEPPKVASAGAWEDGFAAVETVDFHMTGRFAAVKGAMSGEHHDDRSVIVCTRTGF